MTSSISLTDMTLAGVSILIAGGIAFLTKNLLRKYKRPNGKKGGIMSIHVSIAFATVTAIALITKDWFLTALSVLLAYLIARGRLDEGQHYNYQVVASAIIGIAIPYAIIYFYNKKWDSLPEREEFSEKPRRAHDNRHEADDAPELKLKDRDRDRDHDRDYDIESP